MGRHELELGSGRVSYRETGSGPPVLFVHGLLVDGSLWRQVVPAVAARARCIVPDWPLGSHRTAMDPGADLSPRGVARLVGEFVERLGLDDVTVVANDSGGAICQLLVTERPERIGRLVLTPCDSFDNFFPPLFRPLQLAARVPGLLTAALQPLRIERLRRLPMAYGLLTKRPIPKAVTDAWLEPFLTDAEIRRDTRKFVQAVDSRDTLAAADLLPRFDRPALVAWASEDRVFGVESGRRLAKLMPQARLELIDDSYSFVPEDQPERLAELIGEFVDH